MVSIHCRNCCFGVLRKMTESNVKFFNVRALCLSAAFHAVAIFFLTDQQHESGRPQSNIIPLMQLQLLPVQQSENPSVKVFSEAANLTVPLEQATPEISEMQGKPWHTEVPLSNSATYYYSALELTEKAQVIEDLPKDFSLSVRDGDPLSAIVLMMINEYGEIDNVKIEMIEASESRFSEETELALNAALRQMRFLPGKIEGKAVKSFLRLEILLENISSPVNLEQIHALKPD